VSLRLPLPVGLAYGRDGRVVLNPDEEVQARLQLLFAKFQELRSAKAVMRHLRQAGLRLPVRPLLRGPAPQEVFGQLADSARVLHVLKNPAYAGANVYGRRCQNPIGRRPGSRHGRTMAVAPQDWPVCLENAYPGYISWEEFMANQRRLADNLNRYDANRPGAPRKGGALLQGIVVCGRCGRRMCLRYSGPHCDYPVYQCTADQQQDGGRRCQEVRALSVDAEVEKLALAALAPDRIAVAIAALGELEDEARLPERQWALKRERARYEAERARRQYDVVEPENRLVARSLERAWEERLRQVEQVEAEHGSWRREQPISLTDADRDQLLSLGQNLPQLWNAATTVPAEPKQILRLLLKEVALDQRRERGQVWIRIVWQTGATSGHRIQRRVQVYADYANLERLEERNPRPQCSAKDGWRDRYHPQCGRSPIGTSAPLQRRRDSSAAQAMGNPDGEDQREGGEPAALGRHLFGSRRGGGSDDDTPNGIQMAAQGTTDWPVTGQGCTLEDHPVGPADHRVEGAGTAHHPIEDGGIMKPSARRTRRAIRRRSGWW
jgi:hypothetical protein